MNARSSVVSMMAAATLMLVASLAQGQTTANGPYYATPSWDQTLPAATRFIVLSNMNSDAVLDRETGLVWERAPGLQTATFDLADAFLCNLKNIGGRKGWRVPSVWELLTLVDSTQNPPLPAGNPFNLGSGAPRFWTNTPLSVGFGAVTAWVVAFVNDGFSGTSGTTQQFRAWCVRGPGGTAPVNPAMQ